MECKRTINRKKGVEMCVDWMFSGRPRKEIVQELVEKYGMSESAVDKWMKVARPIVAERQAVADAIAAKVNQEEIEASAKRLNISKERLLERLAFITFWDPGAEVKPPAIGEDGEIEEGVPDPGEGLRIRAADQIRAGEAMAKIMGWYAPEKKEVNAKVQNLSDEPVIFD